MSGYTERRAGMLELTRSRSGPVGQLIARVTRDALVASQANALPHRRTGRYGGSFTPNVDGSLTGHVVNSDPVAVILELGSRPHLIRPNPPRRFLRFPAGGRIVFARIVRHPGTKPYKIMGRALETALAPYRR